jgi:uncharacterized protein
MGALIPARYVPEFSLRIRDQDIPAAVRASVTNLKLETGLNASSRVEVQLANTNLRWLQQHIVGLGFSPLPSGVRIGELPGAPSPESNGMFDLDNKVTLALGYAPGPLTDLFIGEITGIQANFPSAEMPSLTLVAHDYLNRMAEGTYARGFGLLPDFVIAMILAAENRLIPFIEPTVIAASTVTAALNIIFKGTGTKQKSQSHARLLAEIAALYDSEYHVEGDVLYLTRFMKEYEPRLTLAWGESLLDFAPKITSVGDAFGVAMKITLREIPLDFFVKIYWDFDRESVGIVVLPGITGGVGPGGAAETIMSKPVSCPADITNSALLLAHELRTKLNERLTATGTAIGDPRIVAGAVIRFENLGPDFSGDYRVVSATHTMGTGGYRTNFKVRREMIP